MLSSCSVHLIRCLSATALPVVSLQSGKALDHTTEHPSLHWRGGTHPGAGHRTKVNQDRSMGFRAKSTF